MTRTMSAVVALCLVAGCAGSVAEPPADAASTETVREVTPHEAYAGVWRSVTPSLEFVRLSLHSKSSQMGVLGARLTFSGVAWEGGGRVEGDSLRASMSMGGATAPSGELVAHTSDARTLTVRLRTAAGVVTDLTFVREH